MKLIIYSVWNFINKQINKMNIALGGGEDGVILILVDIPPNG